MNFLQGKKTYIVVALIVAASIAQAQNIVIPEYVWTLLGALGLGAVRAAVANVNGN